MIERVIEWSLRNRFVVACATLLVIALGIRAVYQTPVDAFPDLTENQVLVYADWEGRSPQEVEDQVTYPLSTGLQGLKGVKEVRANSMVAPLPGWPEGGCGVRAGVAAMPGVRPGAGPNGSLRMREASIPSAARPALISSMNGVGPHRYASASWGGSSSASRDPLRRPASV